MMPGGNVPFLAFEIVQGQSDLPEIVAALASSRRLARRLHRRQQQRNQNADDRDDHQQLH